MSFDLTINSERRYEKFIERVSKGKLVWGLTNEEGWCVCESNEYEDTDVMPFWSDEAYARQCAIEGWSNYHPTPIPLEEFMNSWLYGMNEDGLLVGVNWNAKLIGLEIEPAELFSKLERKIS